MLYVLPPPRAPDPPSPWESILCAGGNSNASVSDRAPWADVKQMPMKPPIGTKVLNIKLRRNNDSTKGVPNDKDDTRASKSLSECYFAGKGTALVLPPHERLRPKRRSSAQGSDIQQHLQSMFYLLRPAETLKMAVKLESVHPLRTRYLVVVSCLGGGGSTGRPEAEESCLLGIDCNEKTTIGLVLRVLADTTITLDGDGGFSVTVCGRHHIFKPVSVQAMWSALQSLHKISGKAREQNYFAGGPTHDWVSYYEQRIESDRSCLNEWHAMDSLESRRPPSPDSIRTKPREREEAEMIIRATLKEIMMSVDLDEVTSKCIRNRLEEDLNMNLGEFKSFIDQEMLTILGQMDSPTEIFDHVYLGSEWNASNFEELQKNGVGHILNVTREIDNFFPGMFDYLNIRVYDDEKTDLLKYWDNTFKYITKAKKEGSKVLVHCKMGVSRSASVVIAYAMKAYNWNFEKALKHVKEKRSCIKPNNSFIAQLETYQGILDAMKNKEKLQRSKSETNLKSPEVLNKSEKKTETDSSIPEKTENKNLSGRALKQIGVRPKSWSPDNHQTKSLLLEQNAIPAFFSLENLSKNPVAQNQKTAMNHVENARNILIPFNNGQSYSVSPNQIVHIPGNCTKENRLIDNTEKPKGMVLNLTTQFEGDKSKPPSPVEAQFEDKTTPQKDTWDPGENQCLCNKSEDVVWTSSAVLKQTVNDSVLNVDISKPDSNISKVIVRKEGDPFSNRLDRVFDREERKQRNSVVQPEADETRKCPSRQSSWSSYDSAVVLGYQGETRDTPSRHSSWGSGDTRTLPSRNSSWGSYDMRRGQIGHVITEKEDKSSDILSASSSGMFPYDKDEIPWYPGTVKRTKQKLEGNSEKRVCSVPKNLNSDTSGSQNKSPSVETLSEFSLANATEYKSGIMHYQSSPTLCSSKKSLENLKGKSKEIDIINDVVISNESRLSVSAPGSSSLSVISSDFVPLSPDKNKKSDSFIQTKKSSDSLNKPDTNSDCVQGIVKNLKKEFEAKTNTQNGEFDKEKQTVSLPVTPKTTTDETEDLSVKELVGKYEINNSEDNKSDSDIQNSPILRTKCIFNNKNVRYSCIEVLSDGQEKETFNTIIPSSLMFSEPERPKKPLLNPGAPITTFVTSTVVKAAAKKQQQLRNRDYHTNYNMKTRNHPTHNTM